MIHDIGGLGWSQTAPGSLPFPEAWSSPDP
jgi:hypothetical protein